MDGIGWASPPGERNQIGGKTGDGTKLAEPRGRNQKADQTGCAAGEPSPHAGPERDTLRHILPVWRRPAAHIRKRPRQTHRPVGTAKAQPPGIQGAIDQFNGLP